MLDIHLFVYILSYIIYVLTCYVYFQSKMAALMNWSIKPTY